jgi:acetyl-CoA carboxylase biotin carboxyl carrier protein
MTEKKAVPTAAFDPHLVETLGEIAKRLDLSEIEVTQGELRIRVTRQGGALLVAPATEGPVAPAKSAAPSTAWSPALAEVHPGAVRSPMVGTAYLRPAPETPPFVAIGSQVKVGDKILLIEAMKTFNEIVAPRAGTVVAILVEDAQPVEFDQPLVVIE